MKKWIFAISVLLNLCMSLQFLTAQEGARQDPSSGPPIEVESQSEQPVVESTPFEEPPQTVEQQFTRKTPVINTARFRDKNTRSPRVATPTPQPDTGKMPAKYLPRPATEEKKVAAPGHVIIDFQEGHIKQLIKSFSEMLGKNITYDESINGSISIIGPKEVTKGEAKRIFEGALDIMGYTVIWGWPVSKVVPVGQAKTEGNIPVY